MASRAALDRTFVVVSLALVAVVAVLQATMVTRLLASHLAAAPTAPIDAPASVEASRPHHSASADVVLGNNPFDSATRDLHPVVPAGAVQVSPAGYSSPYLAPPCPGVRVIATASADDPSRSFALLSGGAGEPTSARLRSRGDHYGGREVMFIAFDRAFLAEGSALCQAEMYAPPTPAVVGAAPASPLPPVSRGIRQLSPGTYEVERATLDRLREAPQDVFRGVRALPEMVDGRPSGVRLFGVSDTSPLTAIGLASGDKLEKINGLALGDPESFLRAYGALGASDHFTVEFTRQGARQTIDVRIK